MGETPLYQAVDMEQIEHVILLLKHKADPNLCQTDGLTPLHIAVNKQNVQIVQCLLSSNANPNMKSTCYGQTPVHFAIKNNVNPLYNNFLRPITSRNLPANNRANNAPTTKILAANPALLSDALNCCIAYTAIDVINK